MIDLGPWLWGARTDSAVFAGTAAVALSLVALRHALGLGHELPEWGFIAFVLAIDVAHVYATLLRTYLDASELRARPLRYALVPVLGYAAGVLLYQQGALVFWRVLAYLALFHFVRQAVGFAAVYRVRAGRNHWAERVLDEATLYAATLYPVLEWHARVKDRHFAWFVAGDFAGSEALGAALPMARLVWAVLLGAFFVREAARVIVRREIVLGRFMVVVTTAATWYVGIVGTNSDFDFTVSNVLVHGVPYLALLWAYTRAHKRSSRKGLLVDIAAAGFGAFAALVLFLAFVEELLWDRLVWHDRPWLFGESSQATDAALAFIVPLLAVPQLTHYVLDGVLWRRAETRRLPAQRAALGFAPAADGTNLVNSGS